MALKKSFDEVREAASGFGGSNIMTSLLLQSTVTAHVQVDCDYAAEFVAFLKELEGERAGTELLIVGDISDSGRRLSSRAARS
jgi:hypothetical protein